MTHGNASLGSVALAAVFVLMAASPALAALDSTGSLALHRAEIDSARQLRLCLSRESGPGRGSTFFTLTVRLDSGTRRIDPGCGDFGFGQRLAVTRDSGRAGSVSLQGSAVLYTDPSSRRVIRVDLNGPSAGPYRTDQSSRSATAAWSPTGPAHRRLSGRRESVRVVLPGPTTADLGDIAAGETLYALEETLDPIVEPAIAATTRATAATVGVATGVALYLPITLLDVLAGELSSSH